MTLLENEAVLVTHGREAVGQPAVDYAVEYFVQQLNEVGQPT
jgi:hypothetical protein